MSNKYVIGIDLGGTKISGAVATIEGDIICRYTVSTNAQEGEENVLQRIIDVIHKVIETSKVDKFVSIGIGSPGPLDSKKGLIITTPNLPFKNFKLVEYITKEFNIPTYLDNDANVAAIAEHDFGAGKGTKNMIFITVSTGIGGGAILNGKVYRGNTSNALEIGHMTVKVDGPMCNCGNYGCVEAVASGTAIARIAKEKLKQGIKTSLSNYDKITSYEVFKEAEKGDSLSTNIINEALNYLGICVANIIISFDPEMIVIGGGVSKAGDIVFEKIRDVVKKRCFNSMVESTKIVPAKLGTDAGIVGAIALAINEYKTNTY